MDRHDSYHRPPEQVPSTQAFSAHWCPLLDLWSNYTHMHTHTHACAHTCAHAHVNIHVHKHICTANTQYKHVCTCTIYLNFYLSEYKLFVQFQGACSTNIVRGPSFSPPRLCVPKDWRPPPSQEAQNGLELIVEQRITLNF